MPRVPRVLWCMMPQKFLALFMVVRGCLIHFANYFASYFMRTLPLWRVAYLSPRQLREMSHCESRLNAGWKPRVKNILIKELFVNVVFIRMVWPRFAEVAFFLPPLMHSRELPSRTNAMMHVPLCVWRREIWSVTQLMYHYMYWDMV